MAMKNESLLLLAKKYGTPLYVYEGDLILKRYQELYSHIPYPRLKILYAMKANYNFKILQMLEKEGAFLDTVSPAEVLLAFKAGFSKDRILYTANNMTDKEVCSVKKMGVLFNIDSLSRFEKFSKEFPGSEVCLRFNPDVVAGAHAKIQTGGNLTKFGILLSDAPKAVEIANRYSMRIVGIHEHTGSGIYDMNKVLRSMKNLLLIATNENFPHLRFVDFGGGFGVPYRPTEKRIDYALFGSKFADLFKSHCKKLGKDLEMYFEPGKFIVAESGHLLIEANTVKNNRGRKIVGTNSGFPQLIRPMFYDAYHHILNLSSPNGKKEKFDICGNICETGDRFATGRLMPKVSEGDILSIENAGAYCYSMGGVYNLRPMPTEVLVRNGKAQIARRGLTNEELIRQIAFESR